MAARRVTPRTPGAAALVLLLVPTLARAQTTGSISGRVSDSVGAPLAGVTVEATSPSLQGSRAVTTSADGRFWLPALPPGVYGIRAALSGFRPTRKSAVVSLDTTTSVFFALEPAVEESIAVSGAPPPIDVTSTTGGTNYTSAMITKLPVGRNYGEIVKSNPAVGTDRGETQGRSLALTIYGATSAENQWIIDGVNTTSVLKGLQGKAINSEFVEEVEVKTGGFSVENGGATGGVINVVTKSGGNAFHGDGFLYFDSSGTTAQQVFTTRDETAAEMRFAGHDRFDYGFDLGGYVLRDRLWFFAAYDRVSFTSEVSRVTDADEVTTGMRFPLDTADNLYSGKLTWNVSAATTLVGTVFADPSDSAGAVGTDPRQGVPSDRFESTAILNPAPSTWYSSRAQGGTDFGLRASQLVGAAGLMTFQASHHRDSNLTTAPQGVRYIDLTCTDGTPELACNIPASPNSVSGGYGPIDGSFDNNISNRQQFRLDGTLAKGSHELKAGGSYEYGHGQSTYEYTGGQEVTTFNEYGETYYQHSFAVASLDPTIVPAGEGTFKASARHVGAYVQDSWRPAAGWTVNVGLRWDSEYIRDYRASSALPLTNQWQPRLGVVWDPWANGQTKVYAFAGRFDYALPIFGTSFVFNRVTAIYTYNFDPNSIVQDSNVFEHPSASPWFGNGGRQIQVVDRDLKETYQDEITIGAERLLDPTLTVGVKATYRRLGGAVENRCDLDADQNESNCAIINPGSSEKFARGDFDGCSGIEDDPDACGSGAPASPRARRDYRGIEVLARKSLTDRLWLQASYVFSSLRGNYDGAIFESSGETDPGINPDFDYPELWHNASGRLFLDRPNRFRLDGYWVTPLRLSIGLQTFVASGPPLDRTGYFNSSYGSAVYLVPRGSEGRLPTLWDANLTLSYPLVLGPATVTLQAFLFNAFNNQTPLSRDNRWTIQAPPDYPVSIENPNQGPPVNDQYGKFTSRQGPRAFRAAIRVSF